MIKLFFYNFTKMLYFSRYYFFYQGSIDSEIILTKIDTTMTSEEMMNFKNEWLEKWNPGTNDTQA